MCGRCTSGCRLCGQVSARLPHVDMSIIFLHASSFTAQPLSGCTRIRREQPFSSPDTNWIEIWALTLQNIHLGFFELWKSDQTILCHYTTSLHACHTAVRLCLLPWCKINWMRETFEGSPAQDFFLFKGRFCLPLFACWLWASIKTIWIVIDAI